MPENFLHMLFKGVPRGPDCGVASLPLRGVNSKTEEGSPDIDVKELVRVEKRVVEIKEAGRVRWMHGLDSKEVSSRASVLRLSELHFRRRPRLGRDMPSEHPSRQRASFHPD